MIKRSATLEELMRHFIKNMSKEQKQKMIQEFMTSLSEEEKTEMMKIMMPIMMKNMAQNFSTVDCQKMMKEMSVETREKCKQMMTNCLNTLKEMKEQ